MKIADLEQRVLEILPNASLERDNEGQILIYTNLVEGEVGGQLEDFKPVVDDTDWWWYGESHHGLDCVKRLYQEHQAELTQLSIQIRNSLAEFDT